MADFINLHFEFSDWEKAFKAWKMLSKTYSETIQFVVCSHWASSGYWIEPIGADPGKESYIYTGNEVAELEKRVRAAIEQAAKKNSSYVGLIL